MVDENYRVRRIKRPGTPTIDSVLTDRQLLGAALGDAKSWTVWLSVLRAAFGLPLDEQQLATFQTVAGNRQPPTSRCRELWAIAEEEVAKAELVPRSQCI